MDVFGQILQRQFEEKGPVYCLIERDDEYIDVLDSRMFFFTYPKWSKHEIECLKLAQSPILDIGCGAGRHSLYFQELQYDVTAFDVSEGAIDVCKKRGIKQTKMGSIHNLPNFGKKFSTILLYGNNISLGENIEGMKKMLKDLHQISTDDAIILANLISPIPTDNPIHQEYHENNKKQGLPIGQVKFRIRFEKLKSDWINWYLPTLEEFKEIIQSTGWKLSKDLIEGNAHYVILEKV